MPRQLPWKIGGAPSKQTGPRSVGSASPASSANRSPAPSHRPTPTPKAESTPDTRKRARRSLGLTPARSPSTSPPPEPLKEEFMVEGIDHDDRYRMVEDEFLAVAGEFTRHLHAAEYQRLKGLAKSQNADAIQSISRPVTGEMSDLVRQRHAAADTASRQRKAIATALGKRAARNGSRSDSDEEGTRRRPLTSLQGLMDSPRKKAVPLASVAGVRTGASFRGTADGSPSRRLAARNGSMDLGDGVGKSTSARLKKEPVSESDDDDDDLDAQAPWPPVFIGGRSQQQPKPPAPQPPAQGPSQTRLENAVSDSSSLGRGITSIRYPADHSSHSEMRSAASVKEEKDDDDDFFARLRARRASQKQRREQPRPGDNIKREPAADQSATLNQIPFI